MKRTLIASIAAAAVFMVAGVAGAGGKPDGATCHVHKSCQSKLCLRQTPTDKFGKCCDAHDCASQNAQCGEIDNGCGTPIQCGECGPGSSCVNNECVGTSTTLPPQTTTTLSVTTTTNESGCGHFTCSPAIACSANPDCQLFETTTETCGVCSLTVSLSCGDYTDCTQASDCNPGENCVINTCCGTGECVPACPPDASTTTTAPPTTTSSTTTTTTTTTAAPTTSTTLSGVPLRSCVGHCGEVRTVPPGSGPNCYCDQQACSYLNNDGCPDFYPTCDVSPTYTCD